MSEPFYCVVCGQGSHRKDWASLKNPACDSHSKEQIAQAIAAKNPTPAPPVSPGPVLVPKAQPPAPTK